MTNCPNCNAPIEPYNCKCKYCGTYYFDFSGIDLLGDKPCYVKVGNTVALTYPRLEEVECIPDYETYTDIRGRLYTTMVRKNITIRANFDVIEYKEKGEKNDTDRK